MYRRLFWDPIVREPHYTLQVYQDVTVGLWGDAVKEFGYTDDIYKLSDPELIDLFNEYKDEHTDRYFAVICKDGKPYAMSPGNSSGDFSSQDFTYNDHMTPALYCYLSDDGSSGHWAIYMYHNHVVRLVNDYDIDITDYEDRIYDGLA